MKGCEAKWMHSPSRREGDGVALWAVAFGLALEGHVEEGVDCAEGGRLLFVGLSVSVRSSRNGLGGPNGADRDFEDGCVPLAV